MIQSNTRHIRPFLKWAGGKKKILSVIDQHLPKDYNTYIEPFVGGGALLFHLQPAKAIINDINHELINIYQVIKHEPEALISSLKSHVNESAYFYRIRSLDRNPEYAELSRVERASRLLFMNKTCYNGLFRVNNQGKFNAPFGKYKNPNIVNENVIRSVSYYLNNTNILILNDDFEKILTMADKNSFVYLDPPYDPVSQTSNFTGYAQNGFNREAQKRLCNCCQRLHQKGIKFLLSNSATEFIKNLYADFNIDHVQVSRPINTNAAKRGKVNELLIKNYD